MKLCRDDETAVSAAAEPLAVTRLFQRIELRDVRRYFLLMRSYLQEDEDNKIILALDSTSISSYSTRLTHIEYGKNKDDDALPQLNVLFLVDQKSGLPIFIAFMTEMFQMSAPFVIRLPIRPF